MNPARTFQLPGGQLVLATAGRCLKVAVARTGRPWKEGIVYAPELIALPMHTPRGAPNWRPVVRRLLRLLPRIDAARFELLLATTQRKGGAA